MGDWGEGDGVVGLELGEGERMRMRTKESMGFWKVGGDGSGKIYWELRAEGMSIIQNTTKKNCVEALAEVWKHTISDTMNERACVLMDYLRKETLGVLSTPFKLEIP